MILLIKFNHFKLILRCEYDNIQQKHKLIENFPLKYKYRKIVLVEIRNVSTKKIDLFQTCLFRKRIKTALTTGVLKLYCIIRPAAIYSPPVESFYSSIFFFSIQKSSFIRAHLCILCIYLLYLSYGFGYL
jgi:hypothetical protein